MNKVKALRKRLGIKSQQEFADKLGVDKSHVGKWEIGKRTPDLKSVIKICSIFGISSDDFLGLEKPAEAPAVAEGSTAFAEKKGAMPALKTIGQRLRYFREEVLNVTHRELVKGAVVTVADLAAYELDEALPETSFLTVLHSRYHETLDRPIFDWLLTGQGTPPRPTVREPEPEVDVDLLLKIHQKVEKFLKESKRAPRLTKEQKKHLVNQLYQKLKKGEINMRGLKAEILRLAA